MRRLVWAVILTELDFLRNVRYTSLEAWLVRQNAGDLPSERDFCLRGRAFPGGGLFLMACLFDHLRDRKLLIRLFVDWRQKTLFLTGGGQRTVGPHRVGEWIGELSQVVKTRCNIALLVLLLLFDLRHLCIDQQLRFLVILPRELQVQHWDPFRLRLLRLIFGLLLIHSFTCLRNRLGSPQLTREEIL